MTTKNMRRNERMPAQERVALAWDESGGQHKFVLASCLNISETGMSIRVESPLPVRTYVSLRSEKLKIAGNAAVKYCIRRNTWYQIGLEFNPGMKFNRAPALTFA